MFHMGFTVKSDLNSQLSRKAGLSEYFAGTMTWKILPDHHLLLDVLEKWIFVLVFCFIKTTSVWWLQ